MMKNFIILLVLTLCSCEKDKCVDYLLSNKSANSVTIVNFEKSNVSRSTLIESYMQVNEWSKCDNTNSFLSYKIYDSIQIKVNNTIRKTYYPNSSDKNIFKTEDQNSWRLVDDKKYYKKYIFEITEQDLQ